MIPTLMLGLKPGAPLTPQFLHSFPDKPEN